MNKNFVYGIMFHHLHNSKEKKFYQGSISSRNFRRIINDFGKKNILSPLEYSEKVLNNKIKDNEICLTFDDGLKSQYDVALPILEELKLKAFFFPNSSNFVQENELFEYCRYFRIKYFDNVNQFYEKFFSYFKVNELEIFLSTQKKNINNYLKTLPIYTLEDIKFRLVRDIYLGEKKYYNYMLKMFKEYKFNYKNVTNEIFFTKKELVEISALGHEIGLHFHTHPTNLRSMKHSMQLKGYKRNYNFLSKTLKKRAFSMAHPSGSYNSDTFKVLKELNIGIGFNCYKKHNYRLKNYKNNKYEINRTDAGYFIKR